MSTRKQNDKPKRPSLHTPYEEKTYPKLSAAEQHSSAYRLSKVPQRFNTNKALDLEKNETFIEEYFRKNPEELDKSTPDQKLERINQELQNEDLDEQKRCKLLIQNKTLNLIKYGENSYESLKCYAQLGFCYNRLSKAHGAIRNLDRAHQLEDIITIPEIESVEIAIETAEAHLMICGSYKTKGGSELKKHCNDANKALKPYYNTEISDQRLSFRRDLAYARILSVQEKYRQAIDLYNKAVDSYQTAFPNLNVTPDFANMCVEAAENAEEAELISTNGSFERKTKFFYYKKAYEFFLDLEMWEDAEKIKPKLPQEGDYEEENHEYHQENIDENKKSDNDDDLFIGGRLTEAITAKPESDMDEDGPPSDHRSMSKHSVSSTNKNSTSKENAQYIDKESSKGSIKQLDDKKFSDKSSSKSSDKGYTNVVKEENSLKLNKPDGSDHGDEPYGSRSDKDSFKSKSSEAKDDFVSEKESENPKKSFLQQKAEELMDMFSDMDSNKSDVPPSPTTYQSMPMSGRTQDTNTSRSNFESKTDTPRDFSTKQNTDDFDNTDDFENTDKKSEISDTGNATKSDFNSTAKSENDQPLTPKDNDDDDDDFMSDF